MYQLFLAGWCTVWSSTLERPRCILQAPDRSEATEAEAILDLGPRPKGEHKKQSRLQSKDPRVGQPSGQEGMYGRPASTPEDPPQWPKPLAPCFLVARFHSNSGFLQPSSRLPHPRPQAPVSSHAVRPPRVISAPLKSTAAPNAQFLLWDLLQNSFVPCRDTVLRGAPTLDSRGPLFRMPEWFKPSTATPPGSSHSATLPSPQQAEGWVCTCSGCGWPGPWCKRMRDF